LSEGTRVCMVICGSNDIQPQKPVRYLSTNTDTHIHSHQRGNSSTHPHQHIPVRRRKHVPLPVLPFNGSVATNTLAYYHRTRPDQLLHARTQTRANTNTYTYTYTYLHAVTGTHTESLKIVLVRFSPGVRSALLVKRSTVCSKSHKK
jgi:hypothetical protein